MLMGISDEKAASLLKHHRRALHKIPEIGWELHKTHAYIMETLSHLRCEITVIEGMGICGFFHMGSDRTTAFRCDMDGLAVTETADFDYASSHEGRMHACGHDGHMAMVLTLAQGLDQTVDLASNVLVIFQPAEETTGGAKVICETGILKKYNVTRTFGIHLWPFSDKGRIACRPGPLMAKSSELTIEIQGKSSHAATAEKGIDALFIACQYISDIYAMQEEQTAAGHRTLLKIGKMESGTARNVISGKTFLLGTMRAFGSEVFDHMLSRLNQIARGYEAQYGCKFHIHCSAGYPPVINDATLYADIKPTLEEMGFEELAEAAMISEDFSFYGLHTPSIFFFLGTGTGIPLHSDNFDFDEEILLSGYHLYKKLLAL